VYWTVTASDPDGAGAISSVILHYTIGGTSSQLQMSTSDGGTSWSTGNLGYSSSWPNASMTYYAVATDQNGLTFQTSQASINVVDCTAPSLSNLNSSAPGQCISPGGQSVISITVTDLDDPVSSVTIGVTPPWNEVPYLKDMSYAGSNMWTYTITAGSGGSSGQVKYTVYAQDSHGNSASKSASSDSNDPSWLGYSPISCVF
jgi:hypothetical protein